jgi:hypothetical protein
MIVISSHSIKSWKVSWMEFDVDKLECTCCFCDQDIVSTNVDPCDVNILVNIDKTKEKQDNQAFWCHVECFKKTLHPYMRSYFVVDIVEDDE